MAEEAAATAATAQAEATREAGGEQGPPEPGGAPPVAHIAADMQAWRAGVSAATQAIPTPELGPAAEGGTRLRSQGGALRQGRAAARQRIPDEARAAVRPPPQPENPPPPPEPDPVPEATRLVTEKSDRRLPDQTMPDLQPTPRGTLPRAGRQPPSPTEPSQPQVITLTRVEPGAAPGPAAAEDTPEGQQVDQVEETASETPQTDQQASSEGVTLQDQPPPQPEPLPPLAQAAVAGVLAQLMAEPDATAREVLQSLRKSAYPNETLDRVYPEMGNERLSSLSELLTVQLRAVADQAGIAANELDAQVARRRDELAQQRQGATDDIARAGDEERQGLEDEGQQETDAIAGARQAVDEHIGNQVEAASGTADPAIINARRDRRLADVNRRVGQQRVAYEQARQRREAQLNDARDAQVQAYRATAQEDGRAILAEAGSPSPVPLNVQLQITAARDWGAARGREVERTVIAMKERARGWADGYRDEIQQAGNQARELINQWAAEQTGEQRSWWDRLLDLFRGWGEQAHAESAAWEVARAGETQNAILGDFGTLAQFRQQHGEDVDLSSGEALRGLSEEQQAVIRAYYGAAPGQRNPLAAVAAGIRVRLASQRRTEFTQYFDQQLRAVPDSEWENLDLLGQAQSGGFSADRIRSELYQAMHGGVTGWGTDEERIFRALGGLTPVQAAAVRKCYSATHHIDLDADIRSELSGAELTRAQAQLSGDQTLADVATLREAMHGGITGLGTDEDAIMQVLRGKTEEERQRIIAEYQRRYGVDLSSELRSELSSHDLDRASALMEGDTSRADAIAIDQAMRGGITGWGTEESAIEGVYQQIRQDVATEGARQEPPWTTAQVEAEIARRNLSVESSYNARYGGDWTPGDDSALRQAYRSELSGPELDLANSLADNDLIRADAARLAIESQGIFVSDDDVINGVLRHQYDRALEELRRDEWPAIQRNLDRRARAENWDSYRRRAEERRLERELERRAQERSRGYMSQLETSYDANYSRWGPGGLRVLVEFNMSGNDREMARDLLAQGGHLTPAQEIHYAVEGAGTDEDAIRRTLAGRSREEIEQIRQEWNRLHPGENMDERLRSELGGRDEFDTNMLLEGEPENARQEMDQTRRRAQWELDNNSGFLAGEQERILRDRLDRAEQQYRTLNDPNATGRERELAMLRFRQRAGNVRVAVEGYREQMDAATDAVASAAGIAAAILVVVIAAVLTPFTGGASAAAGAGILATLGGALTSGTVAAAAAIAAATASVVARQVMLGDAYSGEDMATDLAVGAVDAVASYATAGLGGGLLKAARGGMLARMAASSSRMTRFAAHALAEGAEGIVSTLPSALTGNLLNDRNWEHGNPFVNILAGTAMETGMGAVVSAGMGSFGGLRALEPPPAPRAAGDILAHRGTPADRLAQWRAYKAEHPTASMQEFVRQFDAGVATRLADEQAAQQLQRQLRGELLSGLPPARRGPLAGVPMDVVGEADFGRLARGNAGPVALVTVDGRARLLVREGADPRLLRQQGDALARSLVRGADGLPVETRNALPRDLRGRVPVQVDPDLPGNTVRIHYDVDAVTGLVTNIRMRVGPAATAVDIQLHGNTVRLMRRYAGFSGRVRRLMDRLEGWFRANGAAPPGSRAWEARLEVEKLPRIIRERLEQLQNTALDVRSQMRLIDEIGDLRRQLDHHARVVRDMELDPGRGFVAAEARAKPKAAAAAPTAAIEPPPAAVTAPPARAAPRTVDDVALDPFWTELQSRSNLGPVMNRLRQRPELMSASSFEGILRHAPRDAKQAAELIGHLNTALASMRRAGDQGVDLTRVTRIFDDLASDNPTVRANAEFLLQRMSRHGDNGVRAADNILRRFSLDDVGAIRNLTPPPGAALTDRQIFNALAEISERVDGNASDIMGLINRAGHGAKTGGIAPDLMRLHNILQMMPPGRHTLDAVQAAIRAENQLADQIAALGDDFAQGIFRGLGRVPQRKGVRMVGTLPRFRAGGKPSGSAISAHFRKEGLVEGLVKAVVGDGVAVDAARWRVLRDAIRNTDIEPILQSGIIGHYWERMRLQILRNQHPGKQVLDQVYISVKGVREQARLDAVVIDSIDPHARTIRIRLEEDKAVYRAIADEDALERAQRDVYNEWLKTGPNKSNPNLTYDLPETIWQQAGGRGKVEVVIVDFHIGRAP